MEHIDRIFYINLARRKDRRGFIEKQLFHIFSDFLDKIERFEAIEHSFGAYGCSLSHLAIYKIAMERHYKHILIFEDDFQFTLSKERIHTVLKEFFEKDYSKHYRVLMVSANINSSISVDSLVNRVLNGGTTAGMLVHGEFLPELSDYIAQETPKLLETRLKPKYAIDVLMAHFMNVESDWFVLKQRMGIQRADFSDIEGRFVNYQC